ncbi:hypothetical protein HDR59_04215 [bacterium]|nr:hypothetical protein [bacterium]
MPSNYSDSPSMDEILERIKKALSERDAKSGVSEEAESISATENTPLTFEKMKELSSSRAMTDKIVGNLVDDEIFIKPVAKASSEDESVKILNKEERVSSKKNDDVFVLTKNMKRKKDSDVSLNNVDLNLMFKNIAFGLGHDLAISYLSPKIESWLRINATDIISKSQKK